MKTQYDYTHGGAVSSSAMAGVWYDEDTSTLYIQFKNGTLAGYSDVSSSTYEAFRQAKSLGQFYNQWIYGRFDGVTVDQSFRFEKRGEDAHEWTREVDSAAAGQKFTIVYDRTVTEEVSEDKYANSAEDALRQFNNELELEDGETIRIKKVEIHFD